MTSRTFRAQVRSRLRKSPRASCWVMVLAPRTTSPRARVGDGGPGDGEEVHAEVKHEAAILGRDHGARNDRWDPIEGSQI